MKKIVCLLGVMVLVNLTGCATHDYVHTQVGPLAERLGKLEAQVSQIGGMADANRAAIAQVNNKAQQALDAANKAAGDAENAKAAALSAENAAKEAEQMAKKSEKIFRLEQKK